MSPLPNLWQNDNRNNLTFGSLNKELDRMFDEFGRKFPNSTPAADEAYPRIDVVETEEAIEVAAEMPGVNQDDIEVTITGNVLTLKGEKRSETEDTRKDYHIVERSYGAFRRTIPMPFVVDGEAVQASFEKGVLRVVLPKPQEVRTNRKRIAVKPEA